MRSKVAVLGSNPNSFHKIPSIRTYPDRQAGGGHNHTGSFVTKVVILTNTLVSNTITRVVFVTDHLGSYYNQ